MINIQQTCKANCDESVLDFFFFFLLVVLVVAVEVVAMGYHLVDYGASWIWSLNEIIFSYSITKTICLLQWHCNGAEINYCML